VGLGKSPFSKWLARWLSKNIKLHKEAFYGLGYYYELIA